MVDVYSHPYVEESDGGLNDQVAHSGKLISAAEDCITAAVSNQREAFNNALEQLYSAYRAINVSMETMWGRSKPADYINFRFVRTLLRSIAY